LGVTDTEIHVGTITDFGFTKNSELIDAAEAFTQWCNAAGGVNGRKLVSKTRDTNLAEYRQRVLEACNEDFALVGGYGAFDSTGVKDRLNCGLVDYTAQAVSPENTGGDLQFMPSRSSNTVYSPYEGFYKFLLGKYPDSKGSIGIIAGDIGMLTMRVKQSVDVFDRLGGKVVYNDVYPAVGLADWGPIAQTIKSSGVKGLAFLGNQTDLPKLMQSLADTGYKLDWIDATSNAYGDSFIQLGQGLYDDQPTFSDPAIFPLEKASDNPATKQVVDLYKKYVPDKPVTFAGIAAWSAWALFATAVRDCGSDVTRRCVYDKAKALKTFDGGGLHPPVDLDPASRNICFTIEQAKSDGWTAVDLGGKDYYKCEEAQIEPTTKPTPPTMLGDVGKTIDDLK
jgi:ABC-type branched-subunit amino acid transport system substrate-binding protein